MGINLNFKLKRTLIMFQRFKGLPVQSHKFANVKHSEQEMIFFSVLDIPCFLSKQAFIEKFST